MKVISQKQIKAAFERVAALLNEDGEGQTLTVEEWLDVAESRPAQFAHSLPALEILKLLGFGDRTVSSKA